MRRFLCLLLVALLLAGCASPMGQPTPTATDPTTQPTTDPAPTDPAPPDTALQVFPDALPYSPTSIASIAMMGTNLLLFQEDGATRLTLLDSVTFETIATAEISCPLYPDSDHVRVTADGVSYYDEYTGNVVMLDSRLSQTHQVYLGDHEVLMAPDGHNVCYCVDKEIRMMDITTGISRLLRVQQTNDYDLQQLLFDGTILTICQRDDGEFDGKLVALSTDDGHTLFTNDTTCWIDEADGLWMTPRYEDAYTQYLFSYRAEGVQEIYAPTDASVQPMPQLGGILFYWSEDSSTRLSLVDLHTGLHTAELETDEFFYPQCFLPTPDGSVWMLSNTGILVRWYPPLSPADDDQIYTSPRRTPEHPDEVGLAQCAQRAGELGERFGVEIRLWQDALDVDMPEYILTPEYRVVALNAALDALESALDSYPDGYLDQLCQYCGDKGIRINLLRTIQGVDDYDVVSDASGVQHWMDSQAEILLSTSFSGISFQRTVHHELYHIADSRILSTCSALDEWSKLNPDGFDYDYSYTEPRDFEEQIDYLNAENTAFIDLYSMSYPSEDRCRIMENAMVPDNAECFYTPALQAKLRAVCNGMRMAFDLPEGAAPPWEQYLKEE